MILSESNVDSDIAKKLKDDFSNIQHDSVIKRIKRFLTNNLFNPYIFMIKLLDMLSLHIRKSMMIKEFTLFLIICSLMIIILFL